MFCDDVPQELPEQRGDQGDPPVFAARGGFVVGVVFVVGVAVLAAGGEHHDRRRCGECIYVG